MVTAVTYQMSNPLVGTKTLQGSTCHIIIFRFIFFRDVAFSEYFFQHYHFSLRKESTLVVCFSLPDGVFLPRDHGPDFLHQLR